MRNILLQRDLEKNVYKKELKKFLTSKKEHDMI